MSQTYTIVLDPTLDLTPDQLIAAWNEDPRTQQTGQLMPGAQTKGGVVTFADPNFGMLFMQTAVTIASSVLITQINELIKEYYAQKKEAQKAKAQEITQADGSKIIIIVKDEG
ncbi:MAG: hypothetical protein IAF02_26250 [Anaerolineae bacterium]|nr:hypothetical protein [Anaerolineae bacterium]